MANLNNVSAPIGSIEELSSNRINAKRISASEYVGLPIASLIGYGVVKIDGTSITVNEEGVISANLVFDNESMESHIRNNDIHMLPEDRNNLNILSSHISSTTIHFTFKEKESILTDLKSAKDHISKPHLNEEEVSYLKTHVRESWMHFDDVTQKESILNFIKDFSLSKLNIPNRFLITDEQGNTRLSALPSTILNYLPDLQIPLVDYLGEFFQEKGTSSNGNVDLGDVYSHMQNTEVHMTLEEKESIRTEIELLKLDKSEELFAKKTDLIGFASDEHTHTSLDITHGGRSLYATLVEALSDIKSIKEEIKAIKESVAGVNEKIEQYHPAIPEEILPVE